MRRTSCARRLTFPSTVPVVMCILFVTKVFSQITLEGVVTDNGSEYMGGGSEPVVNALVELTDQSNPARHFIDYTDSEGRYSILITETGVDAHSGSPEAFKLSRNYPNPFNPSTVISFELPCPAKFRIDIHNVSGQQVKTLFDGYFSGRYGRVVWDATDEADQGVPAGVYIYSLRAEGIQISRKMLLMDGGHHTAPGSPHPGMRGHALNKILSDQYRLHISGTGIETYEQQDLQITGNTVFNASVFRTVTDIDGNVYRTVKIGNQWWLAENLRVTHYRNGDAIPDITDNSAWDGLSTGARCVFENDENNADDYGYLYNWHAVSDSRNVAPAGWHAPTDEEWKTLEKSLGMSQKDADDVLWRGTDEGGKLREAGTSHWEDPNEGATNESGFSALPGGYRSRNGSFDDLGYEAYFWSSTERDADWAWSRHMNWYENRGVYRDYEKNGNGFSVRLLRDD